MMKTSQQGIRALMKSEAFKPDAYPDGGGVWTIGYGTTRLNGSPVVKGQRITPEKAEQELIAFCGGIETWLNHFLGSAKTTQQEFDAFVNCLYNIGIHHKVLPVFLQAHVDGDKAGVVKSLASWRKDNGKVVQGLVNRRAREIDMYLHGIYKM